MIQKHYRSKSCPENKEETVTLPPLNSFKKNEQSALNTNKYGLRRYYIPKYSGFVPGMNSENLFGKCFSRLASSQVMNIENKRLKIKIPYDMYRPMSKWIGEHYKNESIHLRIHMD